MGWGSSSNYRMFLLRSCDSSISSSRKPFFTYLKKIFSNALSYSLNKYFFLGHTVIKFLFVLKIVKVEIGKLLPNTLKSLSHIWANFNLMQLQVFLMLNRIKFYIFHFYNKSCIFCLKECISFKYHSRWGLYFYFYIFINKLESNKCVQFSSLAHNILEGRSNWVGLMYKIWFPKWCRSSVVPF